MSLEADLYKLEVNKAKESKELIKSAIQAGYEYTSVLDNFIYYSEDTDFEEMKQDISNGNLTTLLQFLHTMDKWLKDVQLAYQDFTEKCTTAYLHCTACAEKCVDLEAKARAKKIKARVAGGAASTAMIGGGGILLSAIAGAFTLGIGAIVGLSVTGAVCVVAGVSTGVCTGIAAHIYKNGEVAFKNISLRFRELSEMGITLKHVYDDVHAMIENYDRNHRFIIYKLSCPDQRSLCKALDRLKQIIQQIQGYETTRSRDHLRILNDQVSS